MWKLEQPERVCSDDNFLCCIYVTSVAFQRKVRVCSHTLFFSVHILDADWMHILCVIQIYVDYTQNTRPICIQYTHKKLCEHTLMLKDKPNYISPLTDPLPFLQALAEKCKELDKLRKEWTSQTSLLSSRHTQEITAEREKVSQV